MSNDQVSALESLEQRRCEAIMRGDTDQLRSVLSADYVHIHTTGKIDDREGFVSGIVARPRIAKRGPITISRFHDVAIMVGGLVNVTRDRDGSESASHLVCQQVAVKTASEWLFVSCQVTRKG